MKAYWLTDLHLNYCNQKKLNNLYYKLEEEAPDCLFLTGDISNGKNIEKHLNWLSQLKIPIYFVFGNHCFYWSSFETNTRLNLNSNLHLLDQSGPIIFNNTAIIGDTGWYGVGDMNTYLPFVFIPDWFAIKELRQIFSYKKFLNYVDMKSLISTERLINKLKIVLEKDIKTIYLLTHFPPSIKRYGNIFSAHFWTHFDSNKYLLSSLKKIMSYHPDKKLIILSGHVHQEDVQEFDNITVFIGKPNLGNPNIIYEFIFD